MKKASKGGIMLRVLILPLLLIGMLVFMAVPISADGGLIEDESKIGVDGAGGGGPVAPFVASSDGYSEGDITFEQLPTSPSDSWNAYTSDASTVYRCLDDFWGLDTYIYDIHWYGFTLIYSGGWLEGDPSGMQFEIIFWEDSGGSPGAAVATFSNIEPNYEYYDTYSGYTAYRFDVDLPSSVSLTQGWVSIQSTYSPSGSWLLWLDSPAGNLNFIQEGVGPVSNDLAFALTTSHAVGGEVFQINKLNVLAPWLALAFVLAVGGGAWFVMRRRQAH
jgi:hypothetical protein